MESWMDSSMEEVCPTEDAILALLDFLVDPLLPSKSFFSREALFPSQEESVAKQVDDSPLNPTPLWPLLCLLLPPPKENKYGCWFFVWCLCMVTKVRSP